MVWYSHLFKNFPQFVMIHTAKGFGLVSKAEVEVSLSEKDMATHTSTLARKIPWTERAVRLQSMG